MVTFTNDVEEAINIKAERPSIGMSNQGGLSKSSRAWDLDGDGVLDEAELALKARDTDGRGTLDKKEIYGLMNENLKTQRELFKMKKLVMGLVAITSVLAASNLGTSLAAAFLAKDTTTSNGALVDKHSKQAVKTDMYANMYHGENPSEALRHARHLACLAEDASDNCFTVHSPVIEASLGLAMLRQCHAGSDVDFEMDLDGDGDEHVSEHYHICPGSASTNYQWSGDVIVGGSITSGDIVFTIAVEPGDTTKYKISWAHDHAEDHSDTAFH